MTERVEGEYHDGEAWRSWPPPGEVGMFDDGHAEGLVASGRGEYVQVQAQENLEKRPAVSTAEKRAARPLRDLGTLK